MKVRSLRRITNNKFHNAFTGACYFQDALYVAFRQGDNHLDPEGKIIVLRSRDEGVSFDTVATVRGEFDTRDAHLHTDSKRMFLNCLEADANLYTLAPEKLEHFSGTVWTDDGLHWSSYTRATGADDYFLWRPEYFNGRHYCAGYTWREGRDDAPAWGRVAWFESDDGIDWRETMELHAGEDQPTEVALDFDARGHAALLVRRDGDPGYKPLLMRAAPPYNEWSKTELDVPLTGPALWFVGDELWIAGRWYATKYATHTAVFQIVNDRPELQMVLPSGPGFDCSYAGVARHPLNQRRFFLSYYSDHVAPDDPTVSQWEHPDVYLADITFAAEFIQHWKVSELNEEYSYQNAPCPSPEESRNWESISASTSSGLAAQALEGSGFVSVYSRFNNRDGVIYLVSDLEVGPCDQGTLHLGYDGPVRVWLNGEEVLQAEGTNPAIPDKTSVAVKFRHGANQLAIALDSNGGKAWGIFARYEKVTMREE